MIDYKGERSSLKGFYPLKIIHWVVDPSAASTGGGLTGTSIATLHLPLPPVPGPDGTTYQLFG